MDIDNLKNRFAVGDALLVQKAYDVFEKSLEESNRSNKQAMYNYALNICESLSYFNADSITIASNLLMLAKANQANLGFDEVRDVFGEDISYIVSKSFKTIILDDFNMNMTDFDSNYPNDVRCVLMMMVYRLSLMKNIGDFPNSYKRIVSQITLDLFTPLARDFDLRSIKNELEDISLRYLDPYGYEHIIEKLGATPDELEVPLRGMRDNVADMLEENGIVATIKCRVKNIYSIYNKLLFCGKKWEDIYDFLALRVIVNDTEECRRALEIIHDNYIYLPNRVKDYISTPKDNMYQSLHTTIKGNDGRYYEIQIRTQEMNKTAETGSASHDSYKVRQLKNKAY